MPTREVIIPRRQLYTSARSPDLEARCRRQSLDIDRLTAALNVFRRRIATLEATNAQLRDAHAQLSR